jgi:xanthine dehydrogenase YagS FAD-binding subunit
MRPLSYVRASHVAEAVATVLADPRSEFLAGGTTEVDLIRAQVLHPDLLVDINDLPLAGIEELDDGGLRIGALARMSDVAAAAPVVSRYPAVSQALLLGASQQLRNMASIGGNLCQRTRCAYFRDGVSACNKRRPGTGCAAIDGLNRGHAILGGSERCIATHPSDLAVVLQALDAVVHTVGTDGPRAIAIDDFFLEPGERPDRERRLDHGELIVAVELPADPIAGRSLYLKYRDRQSYEFALVSIAAALTVQAGVITDARLALGGVATKPWRARRAEARLLGGPAVQAAFAAAADEELAAAVVREHNAFKVELARRAIIRGLHLAMLEGAP